MDGPGDQLALFGSSERLPREEGRFVHPPLALLRAPEADAAEEAPERSPALLQGLDGQAFKA